MDFDFEFFWVLAQVWAGIAIITLIALWLMRDEDKPHWSEEDWWVNRHEHRFDDLQDGDYPPLFEWDGYGDEPDRDNKEVLAIVLGLLEEKQ